MDPIRPTALDPDLAEAQMPPERDDSRDTLRTVMPWVLSFLGHLGVVVLAALLVRAVVVSMPPPAPPPVPDLTEATNPDQMTPGPVGLEPGGPPTTGPEIGMNIEPPAMPSPPPMPSAMGRKEAVASQVINDLGIQPAQSKVSQGVKKGIFEVGDGSNRPGHNGRGIGQPIHKIVFLVDASGSLVDTLPFVIEDLSRLLDSGLTPEKQFNIIFFSGKSVNKEVGAVGGLAALFPSRLESATGGNRQKAANWIQRVEAGGSGDALAAIKKALEMDPDQIHLLSDNITGSGVWEMHQNRFMSEVKASYDKALARRQGVRVDFKTYQFVYADPLERIGRMPTLRRLAEETGGTPMDYKFVSARSLGLR